MKTSDNTTWILLHGALGFPANFDTLKKSLPDSYSVYAHTFPGHASSKPDEKFSLRLFADSILKYLDDHDIANANIFGYSMGGYVALYLASRRPDRVLQVKTLGTKLEWTPEVALGMNRMFDPEKIELKAPQLAQSLAQTHADWKALCHYTAAFLQDLGAGKGLLEADFLNIQCPVTIGRGAEDHIVSEAESRHVAGLIPNGQFIELTNTKHQLELVDSEILVKFV